MQDKKARSDAGFLLIGGFRALPYRCFHCGMTVETASVDKQGAATFNECKGKRLARLPDRYYRQEGNMDSNAWRTSFIGRWIVLVMQTVALAIFLPVLAHAGPEENVKQAMTLLKAKTAKLGAPSVKGEDTVAGKSVPALYFGTTKMNNNFTVVDEVKKEMGGTATLFVKSGDDFVRVATNVQKDDGSRAIGTVLDPKGKAIAAIRSGSAFYGDVDILGKPYTTGYEPIRDSGGNVIGVYYVGYLKGQ